MDVHFGNQHKLFNHVLGSDMFREKGKCLNSGVWAEHRQWIVTNAVCLISIPSKDCATKNPEITFYLGTPAPEPHRIFAFGGNTGPVVCRHVPELLWLPRCEMRMPICMEPCHFCGPLGNTFTSLMTVSYSPHCHWSGSASKKLSPKNKLGKQEQSYSPKYWRNHMPH